MAQYKLQELPPEREPILSEKALALLDKYASDPKLAREFLQRTGIYDEHGNLTPPYVTEE